MAKTNTVAPTERRKPGPKPRARIAPTPAVEPKAAALDDGHEHSLFAEVTLSGVEDSTVFTVLKVLLNELGAHGKLTITKAAYDSFVITGHNRLPTLDSMF